MKPSELAMALRDLSREIQASRHPSRIRVSSILRGLLASVEDSTEEKRTYKHSPELLEWARKQVEKDLKKTQDEDEDEDEDEDGLNDEYRRDTMRGMR
jgi:predicted DNA-binding transcriptional regulator